MKIILFLISFSFTVQLGAQGYFKIFKTQPDELYEAVMQFPNEFLLEDLLIFTRLPDYIVYEGDSLAQSVVYKLDMNGDVVDSLILQGIGAAVNSVF